MGKPRVLHNQRLEKPVWERLALSEKAWNSIYRKYHMHMVETGHYRAQHAVVRTLRKHIKGKILEVGCGAGEAAKAILVSQNKGFHSYLGIDTSQKMLDFAKKNHSDFAALIGSGAARYYFELGEIGEVAETFDTIIAFNFVCYEDVPGFVAEAAKRTNPFSRLVIGEEDPFLPGFDAGKRGKAALEKRGGLKLAEIKAIVEKGPFILSSETCVPIDQHHNFVGMVFEKNEGKKK